jgi:hypothetical protein
LLTTHGETGSPKPGFPSFIAASLIAEPAVDSACQEGDREREFIRTTENTIRIRKHIFILEHILIREQILMDLDDSVWIHIQNLQTAHYEAYT